ncbi:MAG: flagellar basal body P-ring protein FlgI [Ignavibacteriota bacterium]
MLPAEYARRSTEFVADLEALTIEPDVEAVIVVNERTGTIVMERTSRSRRSLSCKAISAYRFRPPMTCRSPRRFPAGPPP